MLPSIDPDEVAKFSALAAEWWDPAGKFAPLHKFNPVRLGFVRDTVSSHFGRDANGIWLAECGYFPGVEDFLAEENLRFFFVDSHGINDAFSTGSQPQKPPQPSS